MPSFEDSGNSGNPTNTASPSLAGPICTAGPRSEEVCSPPSQPAKEVRENCSSERGGGLPASPAQAASSQGTQPNHMMPFLGMHMNHGQAHGSTDRSYDYMKKYPTDPEGKEAGPDARFWKVYLDETEIYDTDMVAGFRNTLDGTLVFAALFSSIITSFIIEASQTLEPDYAQINISLLVENNLLLRAGGNASKIDAVPTSSLGMDSITHSWPDVFMNSVLFASLSLALAAALFSILVKQWLQAFTTVVRGDARERCLIRQLRFTGLQKWKLAEIINALPMFLHASLALFFMGLGIFVRDFHLAIRIVVNTIACVTAAVYFTALILPAIYIDCPYRLPILHVPASFIVYLFKQILRWCICLRLLQFESSPFFSQERKHVLELRLPLTASCISWLFTESTNDSVRIISVHCAGGLAPERSHPFIHTKPRNILPVTEMESFVASYGTALQPPSTEQLTLFRSLSRALRSMNRTPSADLWAMAIHHSPALLDLFLEEGVDLDVTYSWDRLEAYPLQHACNQHSWETAAKLLPHVPPSHVTAFGHMKKSPLMLVCGAEDIAEQRQLTLVNGLLSKGANIVDADKNGQTALHYAFKDQYGILCKEPSLKILDSLLSSATPLPAEVINKQDSCPETPLISASHRSSPSHVRALLLAGADVNISNNWGESPLYFACSRIAAFAKPSDFEVFEILLDATNNATLFQGVSGHLFSPRRNANGQTTLDALVSHRDNTDEVTFAKAYKLMRAKGAQCNLEKDRQAEIDAELGLTKEEE